jgi:hypothetical protein
MEYIRNMDMSAIVVLTSLLGSTLLILALLLKVSGWKMECCKDKDCKSHWTKTTNHQVTQGSRLVDAIEKCDNCGATRATYPRTLPWWRRGVAAHNETVPWRKA